MPAPRSIHPRTGQPRRCRYCGASLSEAAAPDPGHCTEPVCVTRARVEEGSRMARQRAERKAARTAASIARTRPVLEEAVRQLGIDPDSAVHGLVPHVFADTQRLDARRRAAFVAHLDRLIDRAFADVTPEPDPLRSFEPDDPDDFARRDRETDAAGTPLDAACIACQGKCCFGGRDDHGFLTDRTLAYARHRRPEATSEALRAAYLDRLPDHGVRHSCIYHGARGCTLDRELRSDVCNHFVCGSRHRLGQRLDAAGGGPVVAIGLVEDHQESPEAGAPGLRVVSHTDDGFRIHEGLDLPELAPERA